MSGTDMELRLLEDVIAGGGAVDLPDDGIHRICYVVHGEVSIGSSVLRDDESMHVSGASRLAAAPSGATVWRFELAPAAAPLVAFSRPSGSTSEKLTQRLQWPVADQILIRNDSVSFPPGGCAYLHTHQGPGIRCLIEGGIRIDTMGHSTSYGPGGAWFEDGPEPVFAQAAPDRRSRFIRVMVLPARLKGQSSIAYVNPEDREKPKSQSYKGYVDQPI
ncbi:MAG: hypothetical protein JWR80_5455 [Bradyrhizobium sp.]|jgi:hypothetical protein|nr:hypothetical protein [Bradyrhizobium sp.]